MPDFLVTSSVNTAQRACQGDTGKRFGQGWVSVVLTGNACSVEAELLHQPLAYAFAQDLFGEVGAEVEDFKTMFNASDYKTNRITLSTFSISC